MKSTHCGGSAPSVRPVVCTSRPDRLVKPRRRVRYAELWPAWTDLRVEQLVDLARPGDHVTISDLGREV